MPGYDSGREASDEEGDELEAEEEEEEAAAEVKEDESDELTPLGHQSKLVI